MGRCQSKRSHTCALGGASFLLLIVRTRWGGQPSSCTCLTPGFLEQSMLCSDSRVVVRPTDTWVQVPTLPQGDPGTIIISQHTCSHRKLGGGILYASSLQERLD